MLVLSHAVTAGASLYIKQEYLITGSQSRLDLISILALSLAFHAITLEWSGFKENPTNFLTSVARWLRDSIFTTNKHSRGEI